MLKMAKYLDTIGATYAKRAKRHKVPTYSVLLQVITSAVDIASGATITVSGFG